MKNKWIRAVLSLLATTLLPGCAPQPVAPAMSYDCDIVRIRPCTGNPPAININTASEGIAPKHYCAGPNETVVFKVTPVGGPSRSVAVVPKNPGNTWMIGTNDPDEDEFSIRTPAADGDYDYTVIFESGYCIDPRITVE